MNHTIPTRLCTVLLALVFMLLSGVNGIFITIITDSAYTHQQGHIYKSVSDKSTLNLYFFCEETACESKSETSSNVNLSALTLPFGHIGKTNPDSSKMPAKHDDVHPSLPDHLPLYLSIGSLLL